MLLGPGLSVPGPGFVKSAEQVGGAAPEKDHHAAVDVEGEGGVGASRRRASASWNSAKAAMPPSALGVSSESVMKMCTNETPSSRRRVAYRMPPGSRAASSSYTFSTSRWFSSALSGFVL